jgi:TetR/AcrR family transcriptional repressor of nem operon
MASNPTTSVASDRRRIQHDRMFIGSVPSRGITEGGPFHPPAVAGSPGFAARDAPFPSFRRVTEFNPRRVKESRKFGFSDRDLAGEVGIKTASIHYHCPTNGDLGEALVENHREGFGGVLARLETEERDPRRRLERFVEHFRDNTIACENRMCLGAILAVEQVTLPDAVVQAVRRLFAPNEAWLARQLEEGRKRHQFRFDGPAERVARSFFSSIEGALLTTRTFHDVRRFEAAVQWFLETLTA